MKKVKLLGLSLSLLLLTACGGSSSSSSSNTTAVVDPLKNPATLAEMKVSVISTWVSECKQNSDDGWSIETNTFKEDLSGDHKQEAYSEDACTATSLLEGAGESFTFTYVLADKEEDNVTSYPVDLVTPEGTFYTRLKIVDNNLSLANPEVFDGQSEDTRAYTFNNSIFTRQ
jgi:hypothetical protein